MSFFRLSRLAFCLPALWLCTSAAASSGEPDCRVAWSVLAESERVVWHGPCADGYASGAGILERFDGAKLIGSLDGRMEQGQPAEGYERLPNGAQYEGRYAADHIPRARFVELQATHLSNVQAAPAFTQALLQFLTDRTE